MNEPTCETCETAEACADLMMRTLESITVRLTGRELELLHAVIALAFQHGVGAGMRQVDQAITAAVVGRGLAEEKGGVPNDS